MKNKNEKYKLTNETIQYVGRILHRIKALKDFRDVKKGDLGGYIESEDNLSHEGTCWIYDNAMAYDNARVYGDARLYHNAQVYEEAKIYGEAKVYWEGKVYGTAEVYDDAIVGDKARVYGYAKIYGEANVYGNSIICGTAEVYDCAKIGDKARVYNNARVCGYAIIYNNAKVYGNATIRGNAEVYGNATICGTAEVISRTIIGEVSLPFKDIFQYQCEKRILTAILNNDNEILYSIGCQNNITKDEFINRIYNCSGGLKANPHREEYLRLIPVIEMYFKEDKYNNEK